MLFEHQYGTTKFNNFLNDQGSLHMSHVVNEMLDLVNRNIRYRNTLIIYQTLSTTNLNVINLDFQVIKFKSTCKLEHLTLWLIMFKFVVDKLFDLDIPI
jgi:hypothetical protein